LPHYEPTSPLLRSCAGSASTCYDGRAASQLNAVFSTITDNLANLRLVQ